MLVTLRAAAGCTSFEGTPDADDGGNVDASTDTSPSDSSADTSPESSADAPESGDSGCPGTKGPRPERVLLDGGKSVCIDRTEVTFSQYGEFLDASKSALVLPPGCTMPRDHAPTHAMAPGEESYPVYGVDWSDAFAFCQWAGKRLCGSTRGGPLPPGEANTPSDQWWAACSASGSRSFPYGPAYMGALCNTADSKVDPKIGVVEDHPQCVEATGKVFDLSGNAFEWQDSCSSATSDATCFIRGGDYSQGESTSGCGSAISQPRTQKQRWGFRCCGD